MRFSRKVTFSLDGKKVATVASRSVLAALALLALFAPLAAAQQVQPTLSAAATRLVPGGGSVSNTATLAGGQNPTGTLTFSVYAPGDRQCEGATVFTSVVPVNGNGSYTSQSFSPPAGIYRWVVRYSGNSTNAPAVVPCNDRRSFSTVGQPNTPEGVGMSVTPLLFSEASVGDTQAVELVVANHETANAGGDMLVCNAADYNAGGICVDPVVPQPGRSEVSKGLVMILACSSDAAFPGANCAPSDASPGAYRAHATGTGKAGTSCAGMSFNIELIDANTNAYRFTPTGGQHIELKNVAYPDPRGTCTIEYLVDILALPKDFTPEDIGAFTYHHAFAEGAVPFATLHEYRVGASASGISFTDIFSPGSGPPPGSPPPPQPGSASQVVVAPGVTAALRGPSGCPVGTPFTGSVSGSAISKVTFSLDGKKIATVTRPSGGRYSVRVNPSGLRVGGHSLTARVEFTAAAKTAPRTLRLRFERCAKRSRVVKPRFTG